MTDEQAVGGDTLASPGVGDEPEGWASAGSAQPEPAVSHQGSGPPGSEHFSPQASDPLGDTQRPEFLIGAAFVGSFLFAKLLKRLGS